MEKQLETFEKTKDFLVCVDSDGCAMDTMDIKHFECFGPCMVEEWNLNAWKDPILTRWNEINLYSMTRGINRFKGLIAALKEINESYTPIEGLEELENWVETTHSLSNGALEKEIEKTDSAVLKKALAWSQAVNTSINELPEEDKKPFDGVAEGLAKIHQSADVAIVSSANKEAVVEEWIRTGLLNDVDVICAQDVGSKAFCIEQLAAKGYDKDKILMVGDAPGDLDAAKVNGVFYFPILVKKEKESWEELADKGLQALEQGMYQGNYQEAKIEQFLENLGGK